MNIHPFRIKDFFFLSLIYKNLQRHQEIINMDACTNKTLAWVDVMQKYLKWHTCDTRVKSTASEFDQQYNSKNLQQYYYGLENLFPEWALEEISHACALREKQNTL